MRTSAFEALNNILEILRNFSKAADSHNEEEMLEFEHLLGSELLKSSLGFHTRYFDQEWWIQPNRVRGGFVFGFSRGVERLPLVAVIDGHGHVYDEFFEWKTEYGHEFGF